MWGLNICMTWLSLMCGLVFKWILMCSLFIFAQAPLPNAQQETWTQASLYLSFSYLSTDVVISLLELRVRPHTFGPPLRPQHSPQICEYALNANPSSRRLSPTRSRRHGRRPRSTSPSPTSASYRFCLSPIQGYLAHQKRHSRITLQYDHP